MRDVDEVLLAASDDDAHLRHRNCSASSVDEPGIGAVRGLLALAAIGEAATGLALLIVPSLVGRLLLGEELTGVAVAVARVAGIALIALGIACWPGTPRIGMLTYSGAGHVVSRLPRLRGWFERGTALAGSRAARCLDRIAGAVPDRQRRGSSIGETGAGRVLADPARSQRLDIRVRVRWCVTFRRRPYACRTGLARRGS